MSAIDRRQRRRVGGRGRWWPHRLGRTSRPRSESYVTRKIVETEETTKGIDIGRHLPVEGHYQKKTTRQVVKEPIRRGPRT